MREALTEAIKIGHGLDVHAWFRFEGDLNSAARCLVANKLQLAPQALVEYCLRLVATCCSGPKAYDISTNIDRDVDAAAEEIHAFGASFRILIQHGRTMLATWIEQEASACLDNGNQLGPLESLCTRLARFVVRIHVGIQRVVINGDCYAAEA